MRLRQCLAQPDIFIENRTAGKIIFSEDGNPVVVCGDGLLKILDLTEDDSFENILPLPRFRVRFT